MARKILITGAEGQLGAALHSTLGSKYDLLATTRNPSQNLINNSTSAVLPNIYMPENNDSGIPGFNYNNYGDLHVKNYPI